MNKTIPSIDIAKYVGALCVIAIHTFTTAPIDNIGVFLFINGIARIALPFFFCCTGYLLAQKGIDRREVIQSYLLKLLKVYFIWSIVYIPIELLKMIGTNTFDLAHLSTYIHSVLMQGSFLHLWYFPAVIFAVSLIYLCLQKISLHKLCYFGILFYILGMIGDSYSGILDFLPQWTRTAFQTYQNIFISTRNGLFFAFPLVLMGVMISRFESRLRRIQFSPLFALSLFIICMETFMLYKFNFAVDYNMTFAIVPATFFLFCILLKCPEIPLINIEKLRTYSILLYESHLVFYGMLLALMTFFEITVLQYGIVRFLLVATASQIFSILAVKLKVQKSRTRISGGVPCEVN